MKDFLALALALVAGSALAPAQEWHQERLAKSPRRLQWITLKEVKPALACFVAFPQKQTNATAVLVVHERFGVSDWIRVVADELAAAGYIAIVPDLLSGAGPGGGGSLSLNSVESLDKAVASLVPERTLAALNAAFQYAAKLPACNGKIVVAGFSWGGGEAFRYATHNPKLGAAFVFYGGAPEKEEDLARIRCPVYGFYGTEDIQIQPPLATSVEAMRKVGKTFEPVLYPDANHLFMRFGDMPRCTGPNKTARDEAWKRWLDVLGKI